MPTYEVHWSKTYRAAGTVEIEAPNEEAALETAYSNIGDYQGSLEWDTGDDYIDIIGVVGVNESEFTTSTEKSLGIKNE